MTDQERTSTRDRTITGLLTLATEYSDAGMDTEVDLLMAAVNLLIRARDEDEDEEEGESDDLN